MLLEMHCHTRERSPCSGIPAAQLVREVFERDLDGVVLTDHHHLWSPDDLRDLRLRCSVPDWFLLLAAQEVRTTDLGDVLVFGAGESIPGGMSLADLRRRHPEAALVWAHPYRDGRPPGPENLSCPLLDAVEVFTSNHSVAECYAALQDWHRLKFTAIGGTDTHGAGYAGLYPTLFDHPVRDITGLAGEIRAGRCRPHFRERSRAGTSDTLVTELQFGTAPAPDTPSRSVIAKTVPPDAWPASERTFRVLEALTREGFSRGPYRAPLPLGKTAASLTTFEEGVRGRTLFEHIVGGNREEAQRALRMAAFWLAELHNRKLRITPGDSFLAHEPERLSKYVDPLQRTGHRHAARVLEIRDRVLRLEQTWYGPSPDSLFQGHGDYHPKNIFIGRDPSGEEFAAAIDFDSSYLMPRAFDVGTFAVQFENQFHPFSEVRRVLTAETFVEEYLSRASAVPPTFRVEVELFKARNALSIIYYFMKVGMADSPDLWRILLGAEQSLARLTLGAADARGL